ncbi:MAG: hypothetical protein FH759_10225 [Sediminimonas qiaohouensis]|uniref:Uncharacterized protein n=1 Tax=Sediminimonas qiaohouensis TaxID=552061 RepID=A0A7C9HJL8_9RHOB|nr:hypothetical protein [Sediminimonas qiaohouensis]MTJ05052.1 hypothetical protein [Sediminimonas qiaohouensis]
MDYIENNPEILRLIPVALVALVVAVWLLFCALEGALVLLAIALAQGFVGIVAYVAAWVFLLPFMLVASVGLGAINRFTSASAKRQEKRAGRWRRRHREGKVSDPPPDPAERYKWANRLPPYDS